MAMSSSAGGGVASQPNVTPMIDVMLVLLIIFMVVTPALLAGFNAQPPVGQNLKDHPEDTENDQVLGIDKDGNYYLNKKPIAKTAMEAEIKRIYTNRDDHVLYLKADRDLAYEKVVDATDLAAKNGVTVVAMISDQRPGTTSTVAGDTHSPATPAAGAP